MGNLKKQVVLLLFTLIFFFTSSVAPVLAAVSYLYDANGNLTSDGTKCYEYNEANQLKKVKNCSNSQTIAEYVYDYQGNRLVKKQFNDGILQKTVFSPSDEYETVKPASGSDQNTTYYFANDELLAKKNPDASKNYYHNDHLGSATIITDQSGSLVEETSYDPWGEVKTGGTKSKFQYTGQEKDLETGLNYYNARYYDSHIRRFTQPDDIIQNIYDPQSLNRYSYVNNNPIKYTDPTGHCIGPFIPYCGASISFITKMFQPVVNLLTKIANSSITTRAVETANKIQSNPIVAKIENNIGNAAYKDTNNSVVKGLSNIPSLGKIIENAPGRITGFNHNGIYHGLNQIINRNVSPQAILNAVKNPLVRFEGRFDRVGYLSREAYVVLDKTGQVVTAWSNNQFESTIKNVLNSIK